MNNVDELNEQFKKSAEEFSLTPSSGTWSNVEADIRSRKLKRRFIIFFFLLAGIIATGIYVMNNDPRTEKPQTASPKNIQQPVQSPVSQQNPLVEKANVLNEPHSSEKNNSLVKKEVSKGSKSRQSVSVNIKPGKKTKTASLQTQLISADSVPIAEEENKYVPPALLEEDNMSSGHLEASENCETVAYPTPLPESSVTDSLAHGIFKDSLQAKAKTDSLLAKKDSLKVPVHESKWSTALGVATATSYTKIEEKGDYQFISNYRDSSDHTLASWNYHFTINYKLLPELEIYTGIGLIHFDSEILSKQVVYHYDTINTVVSGLFPPPVTIRKAYFDINVDSTGTVKNKFTYFKVPLGISYNFLPGKKFNIALQPEVSFNKLIHSEGYYYNYQNFVYQKINERDLQSWLVSYGVGLSFQYAIHKNLALELTPYYTSFQKSIYTASYQLSQRFQQTELRFSIRYLIK